MRRDWLAEGVARRLRRWTQIISRKKAQKAQNSKNGFEQEAAEVFSFS
jgi:hypothetical protein